LGFEKFFKDLVIGIRDYIFWRLRGIRRPGQTWTDLDKNYPQLRMPEKIKIKVQTMAMMRVMADRTETVSLSSLSPFLVKKEAILVMI
jgi:hypothetical protein